MKAQLVKLTCWQSKRLRELRARPPSIRVGRRATCLLLSADGASAAEIQRATGLSKDAVTDIRKRFVTCGMRSLQDRRHPGRPPLVTKSYRQELARALRRGPLFYQYAFTCWSIARLGRHLHKHTGIGICCDWLRQLVHKAGYRCRRPRHTLSGKRTGQGCSREYRAAKKRLNGLKKGLFCLRPAMNSGTPMRANVICIRTWRDAG
jgi:transposase